MGYAAREGDGPVIDLLLQQGMTPAEISAALFEAAGEGHEDLVRVFLMNGDPLVVDGQVAAFRRVNSGPDLRSNMAVGGKAEEAEMTDDIVRLVEAIRPKLMADGMFLVGVDVVGDKLMEVNVFSPGGLGSCASLYDIDFTAAVIDDLERKTGIREHYGSALPNIQLATM